MLMLVSAWAQIFLHFWGQSRGKKANISTSKNRHLCYLLRLSFFLLYFQFGGDHERTKESSLCLNELTEKAVTMQKTVRELTNGGGEIGTRKIGYYYTMHAIVSFFV